MAWGFSGARGKHLLLKLLEFVIFLLPVVFDFFLRFVFGVFYTL